MGGESLPRPIPVTSPAVEGAAPLALREVAVLDLEPTQPFAFDATFHKPDHFPSPDVQWQPGSRWQTVRFRGRPLGLRIDDAAPFVRIHVWGLQAPPSGFLEALAEELSWRANLSLDLAPFERRFRRDPLLGPVLERRRGMRPMHLGSLYEYLVIAVVLQNATVRRSVQMLQALFQRFGTLLRFAGQDLYGFWEPADLAATDEPELRALKVGYRARSLLHVSGQIASGAVDEARLREAPLEAQRAALLSLYGIGPASAGYLLFDIFHAFDELTHISPWEQRIYTRLLLDASADEPAPVPVLLDRAAAWAPWRALAMHYLWEDLFRRHREQPVDWLTPLIRL